MASDDAKQMADPGVTGMRVGNDQFFMRSGAAAQLAQFNKLMKAGTH